MKTRLIIEARGWAYRLHAAPQLPGRYFVTLRGLDGAKVSPAVALGPFSTLDLIVSSAATLYAQLAAMHEANKTATASTGPHETTLNHSAEHRG